MDSMDTKADPYRVKAQLLFINEPYRALYWTL